MSCPGMPQVFRIHSACPTHRAVHLLLLGDTYLRGLAYHVRSFRRVMATIVAHLLLSFTQVLLLYQYFKERFL